MSILAWIVLGLIAGVLAKIAMPGTDPDGIVLTIVVGIVGAVIGGFVVGRLLGGSEVTGFDLATLGAIIPLAVYRLIMLRSA